MAWKKCTTCKGKGKKKTTDPVTGQPENCDACQGKGGVSTGNV